MSLPSEKDVKEYVEKGGTRCPFCSSDQIEGSSFDCEGAQVWQKVSCLSCREEWTDVYELERVESWREGELVLEGGVLC